MLPTSNLSFQSLQFLISDFVSDWLKSFVRRGVMMLRLRDTDSSPTARPYERNGKQARAPFRLAWLWCSRLSSSRATQVETALLLDFALDFAQATLRSGVGSMHYFLQSNWKLVPRKLWLPVGSYRGRDICLFVCLPPVWAAAGASPVWETCHFKQISAGIHCETAKS